MKLLNRLTKKCNKLCFIDLESTQTEHETIAIGAILADIGEDSMPQEPFQEFKLLIKPHHKVGQIVTELTGITDEMLTDALSFEEGISLLESFVGFEENSRPNLKFVCFGEQDRRMMRISSKISKSKSVLTFNDFFSKNYIDFSTFISRFIKDEKGNIMSLVNLLRFFGLDPRGISHDPLNDAYDLLELYRAFKTRSDLVKEAYLNRLIKELNVPEVFRPTYKKILKGNNVKQSEFKHDLDEYFN